MLDKNITKELKKLTKRIDSSFYFYDLDKLEDHLRYIVENKDESIKLYYACKANPLSSILKLIRNLGIGIDVASKGELTQVVASGVKSSDIISTGPSKSRGYIRTLLEHEINCVVVESIYQLKWLNEQASEMGIKARALLRVQLEWDSKEKSVLGGDDITAFGLDEKGWKSLDLSEYENVEVIGYHVFQWGNILSASKLEEIWDHTCARINKLAQDMGVRPQVIDLGGGLGIPYQNESERIDFKDINAALVRLKKKHKLEKIWMELGRYAVGECGLYLSQVIDRKNVRGQEILVLDGGINHIARAALTNQAFPCEVLEECESKQNQEFHVHGPLCTSLDKLGVFDLPKDCDYGNWLVFTQCGAYGFTESMPFFLCHNLPAEVVKYKGDIMIPRTIKTSADWIE
ncbi:PLP-dependent decarboxylase [Halobacteriovorax vibrionivorans]|uniref:PLP-dependent decarboxylase n=1 Tax=Halobacteriovorax vibrionivorans TaxID=2152716 RepID=A0ABY0ICI9_9BACT|nr:MULTISPECIES: PLP-dependent decarboxylase [Halobacteriovorax]RZF20672.1 PLP-dependent decarboxylase [Halobacteriovorax vibrionivorans]TGD48919.1 PLP-dependent decarboxylase [Halobacteriovorax sp. Y22]